MRKAKIQVIQVPYDSGNRNLRMGSRPEHFVNNGLEQVLRADSYEVSIESIESVSEFRAEIRTQFELYGTLAGSVAEARRKDKFPLVLSGNCGATLGAIARAKRKRLGVIWFDAHGDFNTPETSASGFLDGMGLAIAAGLCWKSLAASIPNFSPVRGANILLVGSCDLDAEEKGMFECAGATIVDSAAIKQANVRDALQAAFLKTKDG